MANCLRLLFPRRSNFIAYWMLALAPASGRLILPTNILSQRLDFRFPFELTRTNHANHGFKVIGVDLSPIQPTFIAPNVTFQIDDLEEPWTFSQKFDFIYSRMMVGGFADFPRFFEQAFENLTPEGWIELADICFPVQDDDDSLPADSALKRWSVYSARKVIRRLMRIGLILFSKQRSKAGVLRTVLNFTGRN